MELTQGDKDKFVWDGYIVKPVRLNQDHVRDAIDLAWSRVPERFDRNDPTTWVGEVEDDCRVAGIPKRRGRLKFRKSVRDKQWLVDMVFANPDVLSVIRQLLGEKGVPRRSIRGIYPIFPSPTSTRTLVGAIDAHPFQVCCIIYLSDVARNGGAFTVWPGSHRIMRHAFEGKASWKIADTHDALIARVNAEINPVELTGKAGTAIFWHHRLAHTPTTNRTKNVRHALIADFIQNDWESKADLPHEDDMWADWPLEERHRGGVAESAAVWARGLASRLGAQLSR